MRGTVLFVLPRPQRRIRRHEADAYSSVGTPPGPMLDPDKPYTAITTLLFFALILSVFIFSDLVAVIIIVTSVTGLALRWLTQQRNVFSGGWEEERERWKDGERWW